MGMALSLSPRCLDAENCQIFVRLISHHLAFPGRVVRQRHLKGLPALEHMEVGDDMSALVPDEASAGALRDLQDIEAKKISPHAQIGDVYNRGGRLLEELYGS